MSRQTKFIAVSNRRGGVGKTTVTTMLTYGLAVMGRQKVLVIDLDAQSSTSMVLMGWDRLSEARARSDPYGNRGVTAASLLMEMFGEGEVNAAPYISQRVGDVRLPNGTHPQLDIIPGSYDLDDRETEIMISQGGRHITLNTLFDSVRKRVGQIIRSVDGMYDYVIIDCAPGISHVVWGALRVVDFVLIPYIPDQTAEENVGWLINRLTKLRRDERFRIIPNRVSASNSGHYRRHEPPLPDARHTGSDLYAALERARLPEPAVEPQSEIRIGGAPCADPVRRCRRLGQRFSRSGGMTDEISAHEVLEKLFAVFLAEARNNPSLTKKMLAAFPKGVIAKVEAPQKPRKAFDPSQHHAINILRSHGENMLRGRLETIRKKADLRAVARASGIVLDGAAAKKNPTLEDLVEGIIRGAKHYHKQRAGASG